ncbi:hypothetical protein AB0I76_23875, partial [Micromonospora sp. NPDC049799]
MHPIGANTWIWVSPLTDARLAALAPRIREWGFDVIELPVESPGDWDPDRAADLLAGLGLGATVCAVMSADRDLVTDDAEVVRRTGDYLRHCVRVAARVGAGRGALRQHPARTARGRRDRHLHRPGRARPLP